MCKSENKLKEIISSKFIEIAREHCDSICRKMLKYLVIAERKEKINE